MSLILSGTDGLSDVDGTAATPAIRGTDANTGIFFGTDIIGFSEGGVEAMRIDASGNVGIGTTNPDVFASGHERSFGVVATGATSAINVSGSSASRLQLGVGSTRYGIIYQDASNFMQIATTTALPISFVTNNTERMRLDSSGNLGIGTSSPTNKLDVKGVLGVQRSTNIETSTLTMEAGEFDIKASPYGYSIRFFNGTGGSSSEKARIDTSGNFVQKGATTAAGIKPTAIANNESITTVNSTTYTITLGTSAKLFWISLGNGDGALVFTSYLSSSITFLGITPTSIVASASPSSAQLGISKSANSHDIVIKTGSALSSTAAAWQMGVLSSQVA